MVALSKTRIEILIKVVLGTVLRTRINNMKNLNPLTEVKNVRLKNVNKVTIG